MDSVTLRGRVRRIAIACRSISGVTGTTTGILERTRRLCQRGWEVHHYGEALDVERIREAGAIPHRLLRWPFGSYSKRRLFAWLFERAARGRAYDLICGHGDTFLQDVLLLHNCVHAAHEAVHGTPLPPESGVGAMHARMLQEKRFRLLIANSRLMANDVIRRFGVPSDRVMVIYPGYDPHRFRPQDRERLGGEVRTQLGVAPSEVLVGLITSGDFQKRGVALFLKTLARLPASAKSRTHAVVIGRESRMAPYLALAEASGLGPRLHFLQPLADIVRYYHALDVYAFPALFEEFGQSVQEAMACGVPVLTSARVGATELLAGPAREMLLERPEEEAFSLRLEALIADPALRKRLGRAGFEACRANTWEENFKRTLARYEALIGEKDDLPPAAVRSA